MERKILPRKLLVIKDCTFILPDGFDGSVEDAFAEFIKYRAENLPSAQYINDSNLFSTFDILLHAGSSTRVCGQYAIYELIDGKYQLADGGESHT